jgi:hypothetical protein
MPLDPSIILGAKPPQLDMSQFSPVNTLATAMKLKQLEQEGDLNALTLKERRGLQEYMGTKPDLNSQEARYKLATEFGESGRKIAAGITDIGKAGTEESKRKADLVASKTNQYRDALRDVTDQRSALQWLQTQQQDPDMAGSPIAKLSIMDAARSIPADPAGFEAWKQKAALGMTEYIKQNKPQFFQQNLGGTQRIVSIPGMGGEAAPVAGGTGAVTLTDFQQKELANQEKRIKQEGARIGLEGRRVAVLEEQEKRAKDPQFQQEMAAAKAKGEAIAKGDVAAAQALPGVISNAENALKIIDDMVGKQPVKDSKGKVIEPGTAPHPGFKDAVGVTWKPGFRFVPGTDAASFQAYQDQIEGSAFLEAYNTLRGTGSISEKEGAKATAARMRMKTSQSEDEYIKAAREYQDVIRQGVENARRKVPGGGTIGATGAPPAAGGAGPTVSNW